MRSILFFLFILTLRQASAQQPAGAVFKFDETRHNFGFVRDGDQLSYDFKFTNTGNEPIVISAYKVACECTRAEFPKEPILPGKASVITVKFDTKGKADSRQERTVEIVSNSKQKITLSFKCIVLKKKEKK